MQSSFCFKRNRLAKSIGLLIAINCQLSLAMDIQPDIAQSTIVITATKQDITLAKTDSAVLVKTAEQLAVAGVTKVADLGKVFAGLLIETRGNRTYASTSVRGISSPDFYSPTINVLVDGVKQDNAFITQKLINVERVEFLKGSQGHLYGSNAQGGVINIITRRDAPKSNVEVGYSNQSRYLQSSLSMQFNDELYADLSLHADGNEGFIDHQPSGENDANSSRSVSGALKLHYEQQDGPWDATLSLSSDRLNSHEEWYLSANEYSDASTSQDIPKLERKVGNVGLTVNYAQGNLKVTSISHLQKRHIDRLYVGGLWSEDQKTASQELRFNTVHSENLSSLVGLYLENLTFNGSAFGANNDIDTQTAAIFGQVNYALSNDLDLTVGGRFAQIRTASDYSGNAAFGIAAYDEKLTDSQFSPKVSLGWQASEGTRWYVSLAKGYRPAGFNRVPFGNNSAGYDTETSLSAELGWRMSIFDDRLNVSGALYQIKTKDVQLYTGAIPNQVLSNFGDATSRGLELEASWQASDHLGFTLGGTFGKSVFGDGNGNLEGNRLTYAPDRSVILGATYRLPGTNVQLMANASHTSKVYYDEKNNVSQSAITLLDVAAEYTYSDINYRFFVNNVADREHVSYAYQGYTGIAANYKQGREVGISANFQW